MTSILYVAVAILLLGVLVTAHEFGHFISARACGIAVNEFAIGFGPKLFGWKSKKHETQFSLRLLPLGGYCAFYGEDDADGKHVDDPRSYARQPVWKRMISVLMGPGMNFVLAFAVLVVYFWIGGTVIVDPYVRSVDADSPAMAAGLQAGDVIVRVDDVDTLDGTVTTASAAIEAHTGKEPMIMVLRRGGQDIAVELQPYFDEEVGHYRAGIVIGLTVRTESAPDGTLRYARSPLTLDRAAALSWDNCVYAGSTILNALKGLVTTGEGFEQTSGPVGVVSVVSEEVRKGGFEAFINLLVVISINLGIMNLLPIPGLDGSRFLFMVLEAIRRKPVAPQKEAIVHLAGMALLLGLMIFLTFRDVLNLFH